jgi:predicted nucleic acid-binding protein
LIVIDASAALDLLLQKPAAIALDAHIAAAGDELHVPHLIDLEITQVLRRFLHRGELSTLRAQQALDAWLGFRVVRHDHDLLLPRVWDLRNSVSAYDAGYIALAEVLGARLLTTDARLANSHGHSARVEFIAP